MSDQAGGQGSLRVYHYREDDRSRCRCLSRSGPVLSPPRVEAQSSNSAKYRHPVAQVAKTLEYPQEPGETYQQMQHERLSLGWPIESPTEFQRRSSSSAT